MKKPNKIDYNGHLCTFSLYSYSANNNLAVEMTCYDDGYPEPYAMITRNIGVVCNKDCAFIDTNNMGEDFVTWLEDNHLAVRTGKCRLSGFCYYVEVKFNMDNMKQYITEDDYNE